MRDVEMCRRVSREENPRWGKEPQDPAMYGRVRTRRGFGAGGKTQTLPKKPGGKNEKGGKPDWRQRQRLRPRLAGAGDVSRRGTRRGNSKATAVKMAL